MDKIRAGKEMEPRKDFEALANIAGNKIKQIFATGAILQYFFSLIPPPTEHQSDYLAPVGKSPFKPEVGPNTTRSSQSYRPVPVGYVHVHTLELRRQ